MSHPSTSQICGPPRCSDVSDCISCMFTVVDATLVRQDQGACLHLCNDINVTMTTDSSLVTTLQANGSLRCSDYRTSQRCEGPVYYVQDKGKTVFVVDGSLSEWNRMQELTQLELGILPPLTHLHYVYACNVHPLSTYPSWQLFYKSSSFVHPVLLWLFHHT